MRRYLFAVVAGSMLLLTGCAASDGKSTTASESTASSLNGGSSAPGLALAPDAGDRAARDQVPAPVDRKEVVTGQIMITAEDPIRAARDTVRLVETAGGRVDNRTESPESGDIPASSSLTVRVPADRLTGTLDEIQKLGDVTNLSISRDDVTLRYQDLDARITALQASVTRLQSLIAAASNTADLIQAESALSSRQGELDSLTSQKKFLAEQVDLSTITVQFSTEALTPSDHGADSFWDGFVSGWKALVSFGAGALVVAGALLPWIVAAALIALIGYGVVHLVRRRRRLPASEPLTTEPLTTEPLTTEPLTTEPKATDTDQA